MHKMQRDRFSLLCNKSRGNPGNKEITEQCGLINEIFFVAFSCILYTKSNLQGLGYEAYHLSKDLPIAQ
jgi:hypothetical protein